MMTNHSSSWLLRGLALTLALVLNVPAPSAAGPNPVFALRGAGLEENRAKPAVERALHEDSSAGMEESQEAIRRALYEFLDLYHTIDQPTSDDEATSLGEIYAIQRFLIQQGRVTLDVLAEELRSGGRIDHYAPQVLAQIAPVLFTISALRARDISEGPSLVNLVMEILEMLTQKHPELEEMAQAFYTWSQPLRQGALSEEPPSLAYRRYVTQLSYPQLVDEVARVLGIMNYQGTQGRIRSHMADPLLMNEAGQIARRYREGVLAADHQLNLARHLVLSRFLLDVWQAGQVLAASPAHVAGLEETRTITPPPPQRATAEDVANYLAQAFDVPLKYEGGRYRVRPHQVPETTWTMNAIRPLRPRPIVDEFNEMPVKTLVYPLALLPTVAGPSGHSSGLYLGFVEGIEHPVIIKILKRPDTLRPGVPYTPRELVDAQIFDSLGIAPEFYGLIRLATGELAYAVQAIPIRAEGLQVNLGHDVDRRDRIEIGRRARLAGLSLATLGETPSRRLVCFDVGEPYIVNWGRREAFIQASRLFEGVAWEHVKTAAARGSVVVYVEPDWFTESPDELNTAFQQAEWLPAIRVTTDAEEAMRAAADGTSVLSIVRDAKMSLTEWAILLEHLKPQPLSPNAILSLILRGLSHPGESVTITKIAPFLHGTVTFEDLLDQAAQFV